MGMKKFSRRIAMEDFDGIVEPTVVDPAPIDVIEDEVVSDAVADAEVLDNEVSAVSEDITALEAYRDILVQAQKNDNGITAREASLMRVGMARITRHLGEPKVTVPSVEAFGGTVSRRKSTEVSLESVKEQLKKGYEWLKELLAKAKDWIVNLWRKIFDNNENLSKRMDDLIKRARALPAHISGNTKTSVKVKNPQYLFADGELAVGKSAVVKNLAWYAYERHPFLVSHYFEHVANRLKSVSVDASLEDVVKALGDVDKFADDRFAGKLFPGNRTFESSGASESSDPLIKALLSDRVVLKEAEDAKKVDAVATINGEYDPHALASDVKTIRDGLVTAIDNSKKIGWEESLKDLLNLAEGRSKKEGEENDTSSAVIKAVGEFVTQTNKDLGEMFEYTGKLMRSFVGYYELELSQMEKLAKGQKGNGSSEPTKEEPETESETKSESKPKSEAKDADWEEVSDEEDTFKPKQNNFGD